MYEDIEVMLTPRKFSELYQTSEIGRTAPKLIESSNVPVVMGFFGEKGLGKTTAAYMFHKALNCRSTKTPKPCLTCASCTSTESASLFDHNSAAEGGIDAIRELCNRILTLSVGSLVDENYVFIIDEAHGLSPQAQSTFLKVLDEVSTTNNIHVIFCTDMPHKLGQALLSRMTKFYFNRLSVEKSVQMIKAHLAKLGKTLDDNAIEKLAVACEGIPRHIIKALSYYKSIGELPKDISLNSDTDMDSVEVIKQLFASQVRGIIGGGNIQSSALSSNMSKLLGLLKEEKPESLRIRIYNTLTRKILVAKNADPDFQSQMKRILALIALFEEPFRMTPTEECELLNRFTKSFYI